MYLSQLKLEAFIIKTTDLTLSENRIFQCLKYRNIYRKLRKNRENRSTGLPALIEPGGPSNRLKSSGSNHLE